MYRTVIKGVGKYIPSTKVTNEDLTRHMDTSNEWIVERTGIETRYYVDRKTESTSKIGAKAAKVAIERSGIDKEDIDFIIFATLSPDYYFPGAGVLLQRELGITNTEIGALDIRVQCSGFVYGLSIADQFIKTGMYKNILLVGSEVHSMGLDFTTEGRGVSVIFGDGAGAMVLSRGEEGQEGILTTHLHSNGEYAEELAMISPGSHNGTHDDYDYGFLDQEYGGTFLTQKILDEKIATPRMNGQLVFKHAVRKFPEVIMEALQATNLTTEDISMFIPHQANLRISQFVQKVLKLRDDQVFNNIQKYGNLTAASIPVALTDAWEQGKINSGDLVCLAAFGSGFTWGSALIRWA